MIITAHAALLQEALLELLENACRYADAGSTITVSCTASHAPANARATLDVTSAGAPFVLPDALPSVTASEHGRHGMGLSIVRWVAESHHAAFDVKNDNGMNRVSLSFPLSS